jgi:hypothetical protein
MDIMDHADPKSNVRYEMSQIPEQRAALGKISGKRKKARVNQQPPSLGKDGVGGSIPLGSTTLLF